MTTMVRKFRADDADLSESSDLEYSEDFPRSSARSPKHRGRSDNRHFISDSEELDNDHRSSRNHPRNSAGPRSPNRHIEPNRHFVEDSDEYREEYRNRNPARNRDDEYNKSRGNSRNQEGRYTRERDDDYGRGGGPRPYSREREYDDYDRPHSRGDRPSSRDDNYGGPRRSSRDETVEMNISPRGSVEGGRKHYPNRRDVDEEDDMNEPLATRRTGGGIKKSNSSLRTSWSHQDRSDELPDRNAGFSKTSGWATAKPPGINTGGFNNKPSSSYDRPRPDNVDPLMHTTGGGKPFQNDRGGSRGGDRRYNEEYDQPLRGTRRMERDDEMDVKISPRATAAPTNITPRANNTPRSNVSSRPSTRGSDDAAAVYDTVLNANQTGPRSARRHEDNEDHRPRGSLREPMGEEEDVEHGRDEEEEGEGEEDEEEDENGVNEGGELPTAVPLSGVSFVIAAHDYGDDKTEHVQCRIERERVGLSSKLYPSYRLVLESKDKTILIAMKMSFNRTSNYHLFDMTRGIPGGKLTKKSGNYLGKLRAVNSSRSEYVVVTRASEREEVAAVMFEKHGLVEQIREGSLPRKMTVVLPRLDGDNVPITHRAKDNGTGSMIDMLKENKTGNKFVFETKEPQFENGNYRLNFHGRVSVPSVKNFQLISPDDQDNVICQFGKVGEDKFHLDFKTPMNAFQAFSLALCQFNL